MIHFLVLSLIFTAALGWVPVQHGDLEHVPGEYLITYHTNTTTEEARAHVLSMAYLDVEFIGIWNYGTFHGFGAKLSEEQVEQLQNDPLVMAIEHNAIVRLDATEQTCDASTANALSWGLSRVSYSGSLTNGLPPTFVYPSTGGAGTTVYVADTGILTTHTDFDRARAVFGINTSGEASNADGNGHGTHCAGTIGGLTYGVSKDVRLVAVKVLTSAGSGTINGIINGITWIQSNAVQFKSVISMSLGATGIHTALQQSIDAVVAAGVAVSVAAGNSNANACNYSPAGFASCITVGATAMNAANTADSRSTFSNFGTCVHIFAPGTNIRSAWIGSNTATNTISGTSMACPHVSGLAANILAVNTGMSPSDLRNALVNRAQPNLIGNVGTGSPNRLAYNGCN